MQLVADNIRITKPSISRALEDRDPGPIQDLARACARAGAEAIDINTGPLKKAPGEAMTFFVEAVQAVTDKPLLLDTTNAEAMAAGLSVSRHPVILNGISLEPAKLEHILPLAAKYDVDLVGFLLYADSRVPRGNEARLAIALELAAAVEASGVSRKRLIIDPVVPPLSWDDGPDRARGILETLRMLPDVLGFKVKTMAGLSNLTTGAPDRCRKSLLETVYLSMLACAGLDYLLVDVLNPEVVNAAVAADILATGDIFSWAGVPGPV